MSINTKIKNSAVKLRKGGKTYSEILEVIPVAKSTLSGWLKGVGIAKNIQQAFTEKKRLSSLRGGQARRNQRIERFNRITGVAEKEIGKMTKRELWLIGTALYWAEGSKEKEYAPGSGVVFSNSDDKMISIFLKWLLEVVHIPRRQIICDIYVHENYKSDVIRFKKFWSEKTGFPINSFNKIYFKKNKINTIRKNTGGLYYGLLRVKVSSSSYLNRRITGWIRGINKYWGVV